MKVIITAGGTGGHIYPALSVLDKIKADKKNKYLYIGTTNRMENEIVPALGIPYEGIEIYGLSKNIISNFKNVYCTLSSYIKCRKILKKFKPDLVLAFGGFVTLPVCLAAKSLKIKYVLHEQNKLPGKTNVFLSKKAQRVFTSYKSEEKVFKCKQNKIMYTGNPAGQRGKEMKAIDKSLYGFEKNKKLVIIVMGSQGSSSVNEKLLEFLRSYENKDVEILYVAGKNSYKELNNNLIVPKNTKIIDYVEDLPGLIKSADVVITRAGAGITSEITAIGIPSILIPSPYVANNHQYYNALDFVNKGQAKMIEEKDLNEESLKNTLEELLEEKNYSEMLKSLKKETYPDSSTEIYEEVVKIIKNKKTQ